MSLIKLNINKKFGREEKKEGGGETLSVKKKKGEMVFLARSFEPSFPPSVSL